MRKEYYVDFIEKQASDTEDEKALKTKFISDRLVPSLKRNLPGSIAYNLGKQPVYDFNNKIIGNRPNPAMMAAGLGLDVTLNSMGVRKKFKEKGLDPKASDYLMASIVPFSTPESRVKRRLRDDIEQRKIERLREREDD